MVLNVANISSEVSTFSAETASPKEVKAGISFLISAALFAVVSFLHEVKIKHKTAQNFIKLKKV
jgi:hypothetical protein